MEKGRAEPVHSGDSEVRQWRGGSLLLGPVAFPLVSSSSSVGHLQEAVANGTVENAFRAAPKALPGVSLRWSQEC